MKNIQIIDGALNCTYSIYAIDEEDFETLFPNGQDVEFNDELFDRLGEDLAIEIMNRAWKNPIDKKKVQGIHGTLFYELDHKKKFYPSKKESEMITGFETL